MTIPIENIYYLLSYSWNLLEEKNRVNVSTEGITRLIDLLAKVLINSTRLVLKRGLEQSYVEKVEEFAGIKGKLLVSDTIKSNIIHKHRTKCFYDEFSPDILMNRILVTTLRKLMFVRQLERNLKEDIRNLISMFPEIRQIEINKSVFKLLRFDRNNRFYHFIMNICELINDSLLPSEEKGKWNFTDFSRDDIKMYRLFESFVFNFYRIEYRGRFTVRRESISWQFLFDDPSHAEYIPGMLTDITLENKDRKIIIDTKYYQETLSERYERKKVKSANLYQLFSYLLNQQGVSERNLNASGILLYPTIDRDYDLNFRYENHDILIRTINLNMNWNKIETRLRQIITCD
ncbi:MAG: 5-methylcytosine-specific restriction endonuclease system specificity protein McrC [Bacteroidales bacterium]|nr:5-methylcytosine-specific restriction endonuclease system specificity protein McrC [Bacteroidales bacterium]